LLIEYRKLINGGWEFGKSREHYCHEPKIKSTKVDYSIFYSTVMLSGLCKDSCRDDCTNFKLK